MDDVGKPRRAAVFGASGAIGRALVERLVEGGCETVHAGARSDIDWRSPAVRSFRFDLEDEGSIEAAAEGMRDPPPELVIVATGVLTLPGGTGPERSYRRLDADAMATAFRLNTIGPAMIAKHVLPLLPRDRRAVFAALSARVGSIGDNRLGGWHSYRASKAALNMLIRNWAIELARTHPQAVVAALHPGTVDSALSAPFQANLPDGQLTAPNIAAANLLDALARLTPEDSGGLFDRRGRRIAF